MRLFAKIGTVFLILGIMMPTMFMYSFGFDEKFVLYSIVSFAVGVVFFILSAVKLKQKIESDFDKRQKLDF